MVLGATAFHVQRALALQVVQIDERDPWQSANSWLDVSRHGDVEKDERTPVPSAGGRFYAGAVQYLPIQRGTVQGFPVFRVTSRG